MWYFVKDFFLLNHTCAISWKKYWNLQGTQTQKHIFLFGCCSVKDESYYIICVPTGKGNEKVTMHSRRKRRRWTFLMCTCVAILICPREIVCRIVEYEEMCIWIGEKCSVFLLRQKIFCLLKHERKMNEKLSLVQEQIWNSDEAKGTQSGKKAEIQH